MDDDASVQRVRFYDVPTVTGYNDKPNVYGPTGGRMVMKHTGPGTVPEFVTRSPTWSAHRPPGTRYPSD